MRFSHTFARYLLVALLVVPLSLVLNACDNSGHDHGDDHGHTHNGDEHAHDHNGHGHDDDHGHEHAGGETEDVHTPRHGGVLIEIGDHFANIEIALDPATGQLTAWTSGPHAEQPSRLKQETIDATVTVDGKTHELTLSAVANSLTGEKVGDTSQFEGQSDALKGVKSFEISFHDITIRGQSYNNVTGQYKKP